ncbi:MAG: arylsulfatase [Thermogutta sp.]
MRIAFKTFVGLTVIATLAGSSVNYGDEAVRPNIIIILSDDMGFSDLGCYGGEIATPNLDHLAANGLRFTQFYNTGRCCPTRACLLTGVYPHQAGVGHMMEDRGYDGYRGDLNRHTVTIAEVLRTAGYRNYAVGKWHVTKATKPEGPKDNWPLQRGFDRFYGTITGAGSYFDPATLTRDNTMISPFADPEYTPSQYYYTDAISDHAARFIREHAALPEKKPFFMYVAYTAAHWPLHAREEDIAKYRGRYDGGYEAIRRARFERVKQLGIISPNWELTRQVGDWEKVKHKEWEARCMEVYAAQIDRMDQGIGRILEALQRTGQWENTIVFFLQDNGACQEAIGRTGTWRRPVEPSLPTIPLDAIRTDVRPSQNRRGVPTLTGPFVMPGPEDTYMSYGINWANVSNTPFREYKHFVHEGGIATPLIVHWPAGLTRHGDLEHQPGHLIDLMATCVDLAGAQYPAEYQGQKILPLEGVSLVPLFRGQPIHRKEPIFFEHEGNRAVRDGKWKLVAKENQPWELYDMEVDRTEMHDLSAQHPEIVARLAAAWEDWAKRANVLPLGAWRAQTKETFSTKTLFTLSPQAQLSRAEAPYVVGKGLKITAEIKAVGSGVILAHGGSAHGYALHIQDRKPCFSVRSSNKLHTIVADRPLGQAPGMIALVWSNGTVKLLWNDEVLAIADGIPPLTTMPQDGLEVGRDENGLVGAYSEDNMFSGKLGTVTIELVP